MVPSAPTSTTPMNAFEGRAALERSLNRRERITTQTTQINVIATNKEFPSLDSVNVWLLECGVLKRPGLYLRN